MARGKLTILRKGLLLISLPLLFQLLLVGMLLKAQSDAVDAEKWASHSKLVLRTAQSATSYVTDAQNATRGLVITEDRAFDQDARAASQQALRIFDDLIALVEDNPTQASRAKAAKQRAVELINWLTAEREKVLAGRTMDAVQQIRNLKGMELLTSVEQELRLFLDEENKLDFARGLEVARARKEQRLTLLGTTLAAIVITGFAALLFGRSIAARIAVLISNARSIAHNQPLATPLEGSDELATLDATMHEAHRRLAYAADAELRYKQELVARADDLARTNENLRQQTQENEMFVYSVSHDLRSPLVNLQGFSRELSHAADELKTLLTDPQVPEHIRRRINEIIELDIVSSVNFIQIAVSRSSAIIDSLLRLSRAGRVEYRMSRVQVGLIVQRVIDAMSGTIQAKGARFSLDTLGSVWGDPTAVEQVFGNLIGNAVNYLDPSRPGEISIGMVDGGQPDGAGLRTFYIRDNGLGIPSAYLGKIFVAFQRLHGDVAKGEGIGLALVRRMIERHGGRAWVESTVGVGTTFFVALPAEAPPAPPSSPISSPPTSPATLSQTSSHPPATSTITTDSPR